MTNQKQKLFRLWADHRVIKSILCHEDVLENLVGHKSPQEIIKLMEADGVSTNEINKIMEE